MLARKLNNITFKHQTTSDNHAHCCKQHEFKSSCCVVKSSPTIRKNLKVAFLIDLYIFAIAAASAIANTQQSTQLQTYAKNMYNEQSQQPTQQQISHNQIARRKYRHLSNDQPTTTTNSQNSYSYHINNNNNNPDLDGNYQDFYESQRSRYNNPASNYETQAKQAPQTSVKHNYNQPQVSNIDSNQQTAPESNTSPAYYDPPLGWPSGSLLMPDRYAESYDRSTPIYETNKYPSNSYYSQVKKRRKYNKKGYHVNYASDYNKHRAFLSHMPYYAPRKMRTYTRVLLCDKTIVSLEYIRSGGGGSKNYNINFGPAYSFDESILASNEHKHKIAPTIATFEQLKTNSNNNDAMIERNKNKYTADTAPIVRHLHTKSNENVHVGAVEDDAKLLNKDSLTQQSARQAQQPPYAFVPQTSLMPQAPLNESAILSPTTNVDSQLAPTHNTNLTRHVPVFISFVPADAKSLSENSRFKYTDQEFGASSAISDKRSVLKTQRTHQSTTGGSGLSSENGLPLKPSKLDSLETSASTNVNADEPHIVASNFLERRSSNSYHNMPRYVPSSYEQISYLLSDVDPLVKCDMWDLEKGISSRKPPPHVIREAIRVDFETVRDAINRCRHLTEKNLPYEDEKTRDSLDVSMDDLYSILLKKRGLIPGTKWCGIGDSADGYNDLGSKEHIDICCRAHDHCPVRLKPFRNDYGLFNIAFYTKSHCDCDADFYKCLREAKSKTADLLGNLYFNVMRLQCISQGPSQVCLKNEQLAFGLVERCTHYAEDSSKSEYKFSSPIVKY